jgi:ubiquinone/menaquinone biosynthesis C-methylase UbiE
MSAYHDTRFGRDDRRSTLWKTLCESYFQRFVSPADSVLELGCGYGDFINHIRCASRTAIDCWPGARDHLDSDVKAIIGSITSLAGISDGSIDYVFASNIFEHLEQAELFPCLAEVRRVLRTGGTLNILQPNYRFCYAEYFDDYTHRSVYSDRSLCDILRVSGYQILECRPGFLPLTIKSRLPVWPALIRAYLASPIKPLAKQMLIRAGV